MLRSVKVIKQVVDVSNVCAKSFSMKSLIGVKKKQIVHDFLSYCKIRPKSCKEAYT